MKYPSSSFSTQNNVLFIRTFMILLLSCGISKLDLCFSSVPSLLKSIPLEGHLSFEGNEFAARDYGNRHRSHPLAVLYPKSVSDIANTIKYVWQMGPSSKLTVAARGHGHSINGQSQAEQGIVINMKSLHLTVGGTLSNAGISGQAFRHGPQISNVHQIEVITALSWCPWWAWTIRHNNPRKNLLGTSTKDGEMDQGALFRFFHIFPRSRVLNKVIKGS